MLKHLPNADANSNDLGIYSYFPQLNFIFNYSNLLF